MAKRVLTLLIPCLNEKTTIAEVIKDAGFFGRKYFKNKFEIIVADNGSTDGTLEILTRIKEVRIVHVPVRGYGAALHWGILSSRTDYALFADADGSYPFSNLIRFKKLLSREPDLVLGSRLSGNIEPGAMPFLNRYVGTPILTRLINWIYRLPTTDCNSGMRLIKRDFYRTLNMRNSGMEWASELLLKTALKKGSYLEVPIEFKKDLRNRSPHLSRWADGWRHLKAIVLLKPSSLYFILALLLLFTIMAYPISFAAAFLFLSLSFILFLSLLTLHLLGSIIEDYSTPLSRFLTHFKLVPFTMLFALFVLITIWLIPESRLGTKLFLANLLGILFMWIFLIETIKTHLVNPLPPELFPAPRSGFAPNR